MAYRFLAISTTAMAAVMTGVGMIGAGYGIVTAWVATVSITTIIGAGLYHAIERDRMLDELARIRRIQG